MEGAEKCTQDLKAQQHATRIDNFLARKKKGLGYTKHGTWRVLLNVQQYIVLYIMWSYCIRYIYDISYLLFLNNIDFVRSMATIMTWRCRKYQCLSHQSASLVSTSLCSFLLLAPPAETYKIISHLLIFAEFGSKAECPNVTSRGPNMELWQLPSLLPSRCVVWAEKTSQPWLQPILCYISPRPRSARRGKKGDRQDSVMLISITGMKNLGIAMNSHACLPVHPSCFGK